MKPEQKQNPPIDKALCDWLETTYPLVLPALGEDEDPMRYALRCAQASGERRVVDRLRRLYDDNLKPKKV